jgi:hypothetical protein
MLLRALVGDRSGGFYVDLGAHHPVYLSNTHWFYRHGWTGMNVDGLPGAMDLFRILRPRDLNLEACLGQNDGEDVTLTIYEQVALSSTRQRASTVGQKVVREVRMKTVSVASLLDEHLPSAQHIDFMSVDLEGSDEPVLRGNDWSRYRPEYLVIEQHGPYRTVLASSLFVFLRTLGYDLIGKLGPSYVLGSK